MVENPITDNTAPTISFRERHALAIRMWHWLSYFAITSLLMTVLLNKVIIPPSDNSALLQQKMQEQGQTMSQQQARTVARGINNKIWNWHGRVGVVLALLFLFRICTEFFLPADQRLFHKIAKGARARRDPAQRKDGLHYYGVMLYYSGFYVLLLTIVTTGLILFFGDDIPSLKAISRPVHSIHEICMYLLLVFVVSHIAGVVSSEFGKQKGLVSDMFNGGPKA